MRRILFVLVLLQIVGCSSTSNLYQSVVQFEERGEISLSYNETQEGLDMTLDTSDPVALRTMLMQGFRLYITKDDNDTITISFPSAKDVSQNIQHHPGEVKATLNKDKEKRPDLRPLVVALNKEEVLVNYKDCITPLQYHEMKVNASTGSLTYRFFVPYYVFNPKDLYFKVTLLSNPDAAMLQQDEFNSQNFTSRSLDNRPQPFGVGKEKDNSQQKFIRIDFNFE